MIRRIIAGWAAGAALIGAGCEANFHEDPDPDEREQWGSLPLPEATCVGDGDGTITFDEAAVAPELGLTAYYTVNGGGVVDVVDPAGGEGGDGVWRWDLLGVDATEDTLVSVGPAPLDGLWYADQFPDDAFDALLDAATGMHGVYRLDDDAQALLLLGIASADAGQGDVLVYDPPVPALQFPLADGTGWTADDADALGTVDGESYPQDLGDQGVVSLVHTYGFEVDGAGIAQLPAGDLDVLRVRIVHRQEAYNSIAGLFAADSARATLYVAECLGVVARLRSETDEIEPDFGTATEALRLGFAGELLP